MKYALIDTTNTVSNLIEWDGIEPYTPQQGFTILQVNDHQVNIGYTYVDGTFQAPIIEELPPSEEDTPPVE